MIKKNAKETGINFVMYVQNVGDTYEGIIILLHDDSYNMHV